MFIEINMVHSLALLIKNNRIYYCTVVFFLLSVCWFWDSILLLDL
jgi:hypothetical protein